MILTKDLVSFSRRSYCESGESECSGSRASSRVVTPEPSTPTSASGVAPATVCLSPDHCEEGAGAVVTSPPPPPPPPSPPPPHPVLSPPLPLCESSNGSQGGAVAILTGSPVTPLGATGGCTQETPVEGHEDRRRQEESRDGSDDEKAPTPPPRPHHVRPGGKVDALVVHKH